MPRNEALELIDCPNMRGLEIGPLHSPLVAKTDGDVSYVDFYSTEELRRRYEANTQMRLHLDEIVDVDYVIKEGTSLAEATKEKGPFDYIIASHVIEHVANPIGWFKDASSVVVPEGLISLVVPDKRFTFDVNRETTRPQDWIGWYLRDLRAPSYEQVFDFYAHVTTIDGMVDTPGIWAGTADYAGVRRSDVPDPDAAAFSSCLHHYDTSEYIDVHAGVYTPEVFLSLLELSINLDLLDLEVAHFLTTQRDELEFYLTLRKAPRASKEQRLQSVREALTQIDSAEAPESSRLLSKSLVEGPSCSDRSPPHSWLVVSDKERRAIVAKRRLLRRLRMLWNH